MDPAPEPPEPPAPILPPRPRRWVPLVLFLVTCGSTFWIGGLTFAQGKRVQVERVVDGETVTGVEKVVHWQPTLARAAAYAISVMLILVAHEMGHFLQAWRYGVPASWPYFIPMPVPPFGTMGAVIAMGSNTADRRQLFDIAITGPLAGLVVALPVLWFGLLDVDTVVLPKDRSVTLFADPPILTWIAEYQHGPRPEGTEYVLNPLLFAGWVGLFITSLNLIPIGQLDGGHVLYAMIGKPAHWVAYTLIAVAIGFMIVTRSYSFAVLLFLLILFGPKHPPTANDRVRLGAGRYVLGWLTLAFILVGFTPRPIVVSEPGKAAESEQDVDESAHRPRVSEGLEVANASDRTPSVRPLGPHGRQGTGDARQELHCHRSAGVGEHAVHVESLPRGRSRSALEHVHTPPCVAVATQLRKLTSDS